MDIVPSKIVHDNHVGDNDVEISEDTTNEGSICEGNE
jgi:hypothetical protein